MDNHIRIQGSERKPLPNARKLGPADPNDTLSLTLFVRRSSTQSALKTIVKEMEVRHPNERNYLNHEEFSNTHSAYPEDLKKIEEFADRYGLEVSEVNAAAGTIVLSGTIATVNKAFKVELGTYEHPEFTYRGRTGYVHIPENLKDIVQAVLGLDNRPQTKPHFRIRRENIETAKQRKTGSSFTPPQVAKLYNFPTDINCKDQCIGIIELGGGYRNTDLKEYFTRLGVPVPHITNVSIKGAKNKPTGRPDGPDGEVVLDIEVAAAVAPGVKIAMYFAPNTDAGFLKAITTAIHDTNNKPSVISISWGASESEWTNQAIEAMNQVFHDAAALGVTICCASGDNGSSDGVNDGLAHVDFPASSPYVLACGGTRLDGAGQTIQKEVVWNEGEHGATGGGVSDVFDLPDWQANAQVPASVNPGGRIGRGVPDVAGNADPATGYEVQADGQQFVVGGTSAVAPLWAGLIAMINQKLEHPLGFANPFLYPLPVQDQPLHDITEGNNIGYESHAGWDACTGLGSPDGTKLLNVLASLSNTGISSE
ncbi:kumamolisin [Bacillus sp. OV194]|nr:kumamolisin [Bacillus sp. OV194]